jgi:hypothetical protein
MMKREVEWAFRSARNMVCLLVMKFCTRKKVCLITDVSTYLSGEYVAQFQTTIALTKNGTVKLSGPAALDLDKVKSEKKLEDEELLKLIAEPLKAGKSKNKKKKKVAAEGEKAEEEEE